MRLSDFKSNEYANLIGGRQYEPHEENPMIGFRGASRYAHPAYAAGLRVGEVSALKEQLDRQHAVTGAGQSTGDGPGSG